MILSVEVVYVFTGLVTLIGSWFTLRDRTNPRRLFTFLFYAIYGVTLLFGKLMSPIATGILVLIMVAIAGFGGLRKGTYYEATDDERERNRGRLRNWLFVPAVLIPVLTVFGSEIGQTLKVFGTYLFDPQNVTLVALGVAAIIALVVALFVTRTQPITAMRESRRLLEAIGWAAVLPQLLATLGTIFDNAGVGNVVSHYVVKIIPSHSLFWIVVAYCLGMALFTMVMGNAFAAFPVMTAGIAIPFLVHQFGVDPNRIAAIGMFAGYCGTLLTPMAANFNIVPAALLDLKDKNHVIRVQAPTALFLLAVNIVLMFGLSH